MSYSKEELLKELRVGRLVRDTYCDLILEMGKQTIVSFIDDGTNEVRIRFEDIIGNGIMMRSMSIPLTRVELSPFPIYYGSVD